MAEHSFGLLDQRCIGCGLAARDLVDHPQLKDACPAYYATLTDRGEKLRLIIRPADEELCVFGPDGMPKFSLDQHAMLELRDHIDWGVRELRKAKDG